MRAVIVAGAKVGLPPSQADLASADLLIAADHGADLLLSLGLTPHVLVGDMDSISAAARACLEAAAVETLVLPAAKDDTDLEAALRLAVDRGAHSIDVLGVLGGPRVDHLVGAVFLLMAPWLADREVRLRDHSQELWLACGSTKLTGEPGDLVSLLPLTAVVEAVRTEGLLYPLRSERLVQAASRGLSNELTGSSAGVTHGEGILLVTHYHSGAALSSGGACTDQHQEGIA